MTTARVVLERLTLAQRMELLRLARDHPGSTWHMADCGCCLCFHPDGDVTRGWIVGSDGGSDYREGAHE